MSDNNVELKSSSVNRSKEIEAGKFAKKRVLLGVKMKLLGALLPVVICIFTIIFLIIYKDTSNIILNKSENILETSTESVVNKVDAWMKETITALNMERDSIEYFAMDADKELQYIKHTVNRFDSFPAGIYLATTKGSLIHASFLPGPEYDVFQKSWYQDGLKSEDFIFGSVYFDEDSQAYVVGASGVLKDKTGAVRGVAAADIYLNAISEIVKEVQLEKTGAMFLVDTKTNTIIGHKEDTVVGTLLSDQKDEMYAYINTLLQSGTLGLNTFKDQNGKETYINMKQIPGSNWTTVAYVPRDEIIADLNILTRKLVEIAVLGVVLLVIFMERFIHIIIKPIKKLSRTLASITDGDFSAEVKVHTKDEVGEMANGLRHFILTMRATIKQITEISIKLEAQSGISARVAGSLSEASNLQSMSMNEMTRTVHELALSISEVAESATSLSLLVSDTQDSGQEATIQMCSAVAASKEGQADMGKVVTSMQDISRKMNSLEASAVQMDNSVDKINTIVELIRDIAEETNLLSLNASIEAARAGEAGRGFAVVADQIGKLASTSKEAVDDIAALTKEISSQVGQTVAETKNSASAIKESTVLVNETGESFGIIFETISKTDTAVSEMIAKVKQVNDIATTVAGITEEQSASSQEILATTENIQSNAEEVFEHSKHVAADSTVLSETSDDLEKHMEKFKL